MTFQTLASAIAKREGKKSQARIGDIREILRIMSDLEREAIAKDSTGDSYPTTVIVYGALKKAGRVERKPKRKILRKKK